LVETVLQLAETAENAYTGKEFRRNAMPPVPGGWEFKEGDNNTGEDNIRLTTHYTGDGKVTLTLTQSKGKWWKGITKGQWEVVAVEGDRTDASSKFSKPEDLNGFGFSKAKAFGVHTWMYAIKNTFQINYEYVFHWERDS
jgi:hypothetical protein